MKNAITLAILALNFLMFSSFAQAEEAMAPSSASKGSAGMANASGAKAAREGSYTQLKAECLKEQPALKGRDLRKCIKAKKQPADVPSSNPNSK